MHNIRCRCGKIVCQVENMPEAPQVTDEPQPGKGPAALILCRHCKRYVVLRFPALSAVYTVSETSQAEGRRSPVT